MQAALDRQADRASASATTTSTTIERKALRDEPLPGPHHPEPAARRSIRPTDSTHYQSLLSFYRKQLADEEADRGTALGLGAPSSSSAAAAGLGSSTGYSSPSAFSRIMNLYSTSGSATASAGAGAGGMGQHAGAARRLTKKAEPMRDARTEAEGLRLVDFEEEERVAQRMWRLEGEEQGGYDGVVAQTEDMAAREPR